MASMGAAKEAGLKLHEDQERRWAAVAEKNDYVCDRCGSTPSYDERDVYFDTGYCGWCAYEVAKYQSERE